MTGPGPGGGSSDGGTTGPGRTNAWRRVEIEAAIGAALILAVLAVGWLR